MCENIGSDNKYIWSFENKFHGLTYSVDTNSLNLEIIQNG